MKPYRLAFTLLELLVAMGITGILAALLFPVLAIARENARRAACLSNLHQIGSAIAIYVSDYDDRLPFALDPYTRSIMDDVYPDPYLTTARTMPVLPQILNPYVRSRAVYRCPSEHHFADSGIVENLSDTYGCSYEYARYPPLLGWTETSFENSSAALLMSDYSPGWHGGSDFLDARCNEMFADYHVKDVDFGYLLGTEWEPADVHQR